MSNRVVWLDIPVLDLDRAIAFYSAVLGSPVHRHDYPGMSIGVLPHGDGGISGCLYVSEDIRPTEQGMLVYLESDLPLSEAAAAVTANGGRILLGPHPIGGYGSRCVIVDSEGNRVALHNP